ncbi:fructose-specific component phosphotransferase system IIB-like protein [Nitrobacteraceae bacterium AZCC 2161]
MTVAPPSNTVSLFSSSDTPAILSDPDTSQINLGVRFVSSSAGAITGIKYYKGASDTGTHVGSLWTSTGTLLGSATFASETTSGWQTVTFNNPISITAGTTYVASYHSNGHYTATGGYFGTARVSGPLTAPASGNGVYTYSNSNVLPTSTFGATNYWVDVLFSAPNQPPVAVNDSGFSTAQNTVLTIAASALLANDSDPNGDTLTITGVSGAVNGTVSFNAQANTVSFTPTAGYAGSASFNYSISDGRSGTANAAVSLTVNSSVNQPPVANNDSGFNTVQNTALTIAASALLTNDTDPNGDPLTITGVSGAVNGTVSFNAQANTVTFTPTAGYTGAASFNYAISDGRSGTANAIVSLTVNAPSTSLFSSSDTPAVLSDPDTSQVNLGVRFVSSSAGSITGIKYYKGASDTGTHVGSLWTSTGTLLANATFTNETGSGWQTVAFSSPVSIIAGTTYVASYHSNGHYTSTSGYFGTARISGPLTAPASGNGVYTYSNSNVLPTSTFGATNYWVDVLFSASGTANQPPVAVNDSGFSTAQNTALTIAASALLANDTDPNGDPLTITGVSGAVNGTVSFNAQANTVTFTPTTGYTGAASFNYSISDGRSGTANAAVSLTVNSPVNQPPVANNDSGFSTAQNTVLTIAASALLANDSDPNGDPLTITGVSGAVNGTVSFNAQANTVSFTPTTGYTGAASFNYSISDGRSGTANAAVSLTVNSPVNQPPVANNDSGFSTAQNTALTIAASALLANDTDPNGDPLTITGVSGAVNGTVSFNAQANTVTFTPTAGYTGAASFNYAISDGRSGTASANVALSVTGAATVSLFSASFTPSIVSVADPNAVELGLKFQSSSAGQITGIRFYKGPQNTGTHVADLWSTTGTLLATATFTNETASGWQQVTFANPVTIAAGTTYVASYHTNGNYSADPNYFATAHTSGPLTAPSSSASGGNGVYAYGSGGLFPTNTYNSNSYGVDVLFRAQLVA